MAVDMWSIGCVTTALFAGKSYFNNTQDSEYRRDSSTAIEKAAAECNLDRLEYSIDWLKVNHRVKDFIKRLLVLDEGARLTAMEALNHSWFTEGDRKISIQKAYSQAIKGWTSFRPPWDFNEHLNVFIEARISKADVNRFFLLRCNQLTKI